jgi:hypothetical protein
VIGGGFDNPAGLSRKLIEAVRDEAQVLAVTFAVSSIDWSGLHWWAAQNAATYGEVIAAARIAGAACALDMSPLELLEACGATW